MIGTGYPEIDAMVEKRHAHDANSMKGGVFNPRLVYARDHLDKDIRTEMRKRGLHWDLDGSVTPIVSDDDLFALNVLLEAGGEPDDGKAAIHRVVLNRTARKFESDGTARATILRKDQFSWVYFDFVDGKYQRVADDLDTARWRLEKRLYDADKKQLEHAREIVSAVIAGTYHGPDYDRLTDDAVLYLNPSIVSSLPEWANEQNRVCSIGHHKFYRSA